MAKSSGLGLLAAYGSASEDSDDDMADVAPALPSPFANRPPEDDTYELASAKLKNFIDAGEYRIVSDESSADDSDDDDIVGRPIVHSGSDNDSDVEIVSKSKEFVKARGEMGIDDLPPIEDLKIRVSESECVPMGKICSIVEQLVLVDSLPGTMPLDLDTVLFLNKGNVALGRVFDVLGNISEPLYCVRFNSNDEIVARGLELGTAVFVAPKTEHTTFVILGNLMGDRGCDASWEHDIEPPLRCVDFSDDEEERSAKKVRRGKKTAPNDNASLNDDGQKRQRNTSVSSDQSSMSVDNRCAANNNNPQRFQRGGGRGGRGANFRGHNQSPQQQQQQHNPHSQGDWTNNRQANYSWHNNLSYTSQPPPNFPPAQQQGGYHQPPPPHMASPYATSNNGGYAFSHSGGPAQFPYAQQQRHQHHQHHQGPPTMYANNHQSQQMYPSGPPPAARQRHQQQQQQQQQSLSSQNECLFQKYTKLCIHI